MLKSQEILEQLLDMESTSIESLITHSQYFYQLAIEDYEATGEIKKSTCRDIGMADAFLQVAENMDYNRCKGIREQWRKTGTHQAYIQAVAEEKDWRKE